MPKVHRMASAGDMHPLVEPAADDAVDLPAGSVRAASEARISRQPRTSRTSLRPTRSLGPPAGGADSAAATAVGEHVVSRNGDCLALRGEDAFHWNNALGVWSWVRHLPVRQIKLDTDDHTYAIDHLGCVWRLEEVDGERPQATRHRQLQGPVRDFCVCPGGGMVFLLDAGAAATRPSGERTLRWQPRPDEDHLLAMPARMSPGAAAIVSLAVEHDGRVAVADDAGEVWRGHPADVRALGPGAWRRVDIAGVPAGLRIARLLTMADGSIGAECRPGRPAGPAPFPTRPPAPPRLVVLGTDGRWHHDTGTRRAIAATYGQLREPAWSALPLGTILPGYKSLPLVADHAPVGEAGDPPAGVVTPLLDAASAWAKSRLSLRQTPKFHASGMPARESRPGTTARIASYFRGHYGLQDLRGALNAFVRDYLALGQLARERLPDGVVPHTACPPGRAIDGRWPPLHDPRSGGCAAADVVFYHLGARVERNAAGALDRLESALGLPDRRGDPDAPHHLYTAGPPGTGWAGRALDAIAPPPRVRSEDNLLWLLHEQARTAFSACPAGSAQQVLVERLDTLLDRQIVFPASERLHLREALSASVAPVHHFAMIQLRKIAHDLATLLDCAAQAVSTGLVDPAASPADRARQRDVERGRALDALERLDDPLEGRVNAEFGKYRSFEDFGTSHAALVDPQADRQIEADVAFLVQTPERGDAAAMASRPASQALVRAYCGQIVRPFRRLSAVLELSAPDGVRGETPLHRRLPPPADPSRVRSDDNVLHVLACHLRQAGDIARQSPASPDGALLDAVLDTLTRDDLFIPTRAGSQRMPGSFPADVEDAPDSLRERLSPLLGTSAANEVAIALGKLLRDTRLLSEGLGAAPGGGGGFQARMETGTDPVNRLFARGLATGRARDLEALLRGHDRAVRHPDALFKRALNFQGMVAPQDAAAYARQFFREMATGETITLSQGRMSGADADGLGWQFTPADRGTQGVPLGNDIPLNIVPNLQFQPAYNYARRRRLSVTRTAEGADITVGLSREHALKAFEWKVMWGLGQLWRDDVPKGDKTVTTNLALVYGGVETLLNLMALSWKAEDEVTLQLRHDDRGSVERVVGLFLTGDIDPVDLIEQGVDHVENRIASRKLTPLDVAGHPLAAFVDIVTPDGEPHRRGKLVAAALVQPGLGWQYRTSRGERRDAAGDVVQVDTVRPGWGDAERAGRVDVIGVGEAQGSWIIDGRSWVPPHPKVGGQYEWQFKVPAWIEVHSREWGIPERTRVQAPTVRFDADGALREVTASFAMRPGPLAGRLAPLEALREPAPHVAEAIETFGMNALRQASAARNAGEKTAHLHVDVELQPEHVERIGGLLPSADELRRQLQALVDTPEAWRLTRVWVPTARAYQTAAFNGLLVGRLLSEASNEIRHADDIVVRYLKAAPGGAAPRPLMRAHGRLAAGGGAPRLDELDDLLAHPRMADIVFLTQRGDAPLLAALPRHRTTADEIAGARRAWFDDDDPFLRDRAHAALADGVLVVREAASTSDWWQMPASEADVRGLLRSLPPARRRELLCLMSARETGVLAGVGHWTRELQVSGRTAVPRTNPRPADGDMPARAGRALHVETILRELSAGQLHRHELDPAQRHILDVFLGGANDDPPPHDVLSRLLANDGWRRTFFHNVDVLASTPTGLTTQDLEAGDAGSPAWSSVAQGAVTTIATPSGL